jgi:hypothetical protein
VTIVPRRFARKRLVFTFSKMGIRKESSGADESYSWKPDLLKRAKFLLYVDAHRSQSRL